MTNLPILALLAILLILLIASFFLQYKLSKRENKWLGLILPAIFVMVAAFLGFVTIYNGNLIIWLLTFFVYLIPTMIHLLIYVVVRSNSRIRSKQEIDKMKIQDL